MVQVMPSVVRHIGLVVLCQSFATATCHAVARAMPCGKP